MQLWHTKSASGQHRCLRLRVKRRLHHGAGLVLDTLNDFSSSLPLAVPEKKNPSRWKETLFKLERYGRKHIYASYLRLRYYTRTTGIGNVALPVALRQSTGVTLPVPVAACQ